MKRGRDDKYAVEWFNDALDDGDDQEPAFLNTDQQETNASRHWIPGDEPIVVEDVIDMDTYLRNPIPEHDVDVVDMLRLYEELQREENEAQPPPPEDDAPDYEDELDDFDADYSDDDNDANDNGGPMPMDPAESGPDIIDWNLLDARYAIGCKTDASAYERAIAPDIDPQQNDFVFQHTETTYGIDETHKIPG